MKHALYIIFLGTILVSVGSATAGDAAPLSWAYKVVQISSPTDEGTLDCFGAEGWELVAVVQDLITERGFFMYFKRVDSVENMERSFVRKAMELALACHVYAGNHDGALPPSLADARPHFGEGLTKDRSFSIADYDLVASGKLQGFTRPSGEVIMIRRKQPLSPGRYVVAFLDSHGEIVEEQ